MKHRSLEPLLIWIILILAKTTVLEAGDDSVSSPIIIPHEEWNRTFGGSSEDVGNFVQGTSDGGYIIIGYTTSYGADVPYSWLIKAPLRGDIWLIKTDSKGNKEWDKTFGGFGKDLGFSVQQTRDGGYFITGGKKTFWVGDYNLWVIKTGPKGETEWDKTFGGSNDDLGFMGQQTADGGYIVTGYTSSYGYGNRALWLIKLDSNGNKEWDSIFGGKNPGEGAYVQQTADGGYIVTGYTSSYGAGNEDVWLLKYDAEGTREWAKTFGGPKRDVGMSVRQTKDGGYVITGFTESFGSGKGDIWLIKTDLNGEKEWDKTFGGPYYDIGASVQQTKDGGYIISGTNATSINVFETGYSQLLNPMARSQSNAWLIKTDSKGNKEWDMAFGGSRNDWSNSVQETNEGGYILAGVSESYGEGNKDVWLIKVNLVEPFQENLSIQGGIV